jgi:hypothetical protein
VLRKFFETRKRAERDDSELGTLRVDYGSDLKTILWQRANDTNLGDRDRKHWQRLLRKADRFLA